MQTIKTTVAALALISFAATGVLAEDTTSDAQSKSSIKQSELKPKNKVKGDIDEEITNKKLRAELGSKSKYSMSTSIGYYGGSIEKPLSDSRPNLTGAAVAPAVRMIGDISGRYRIDKRQSIKAGTGITVIQPFHEAKEEQGDKEYMDKIEASDPFVGYSYAGKMGDLMSINGATLTYYTADSYRDDRYQFDFTVSNTLVKSFKNGWQLGLATYVGGATFDGKTNSAGKDVTASQTDYSFAFYPFAEYTFNDTYNFRTVFRQTTFRHRRNFDDSTDFVRGAGSQSVGLGISVTRDVFLYPNFQFSTENLSAEFFTDRFAEESTVGLSASINMF